MPTAIVINPDTSRYPSNPLDALALALAPRSRVASQEPSLKSSDWLGPANIDVVRRKLLRQPVFKASCNVTIDGTFIPCVLMSTGWWERGSQAAPPDVPWRTPVQQWLFRGFEAWAPSWDISSVRESVKPGFIFGQIGSGDEADSLFVIIPTEKASSLRDALGQSLHKHSMGTQVRVKGQLCHRDHLPKEERIAVMRWGKAFDYFIRIDRANNEHGIEPAGAPPSMYSGYLWQSLVPQQWWQDTAHPPELKNTFFVWEHTDFTKPDAVAYNLDSLARKAAYIESKFGKLTLLQKSSELVTGDPYYSVESFYHYVLGGHGQSSGTVVNP